MIYILIIAIIVVAIALVFAYYENNTLENTKYKVKAEVKNKIKIVQISDLHGKSFGKNNKKLLSKLKETEGDLFIATGDMIDSNKKRMRETIDFLVELNKISKVIYIPGNNEERCKEADNIIQELKSRGVIALKNEIIDINICGNKISILGLSEELESKNNIIMAKIKDTYITEGYEVLFKEFEKREGLKIVLSHYPQNFRGKEAAEYSKYDFDVMFAGHAHGGQFILPVLGGLFAPGQGILPKYYKGIHNSQYNNSKLIISRGLGNSGFPLRLFNRPEIVEVVIDK